MFDDVSLRCALSPDGEEYGRLEVMVASLRQQQWEAGGRGASDGQSRYNHGLKSVLKF